MMRALLLALILWSAGLAPAHPQSVIADVSQNLVSITADFDGSEILIFGAISDHPASRDPLEVIVTVSGPMVPVDVRRKNRVAGIWINTEVVRVDRAPTLYSVSTTGPLDQVLSQTDDLRYAITIDRAIRSVGAPGAIANSQDFTAALIRLKQAQGLYRVQEGAVSVEKGILFRTNVALPANLVEGNYTTRVYLTHDKVVVAQFERVIGVSKVGLERWIYALAHEQPLIYSALSLALAIAAGWGASAMFRYLRG